MVWSMRYVITILVALCPWVAFAQTPLDFHSASTTVRDGNEYNVYDNGTISVQIEGTFVGTLQFQARADENSAAVQIRCTNTTDDTRSTSATAPGLYQCSVSGFKRFKVPVTAYTSGTIKAVGWYGKQVSSRGGGGLTPLAAFPASPSVGDYYLIIDDSAVGACDSAGGVARSICYWTGSVWAATGDGAGSGAGDVGQVFTCLSGDCSALTAAAGDSLNMSAGDSSRPATQSTALPGTCLEGQFHQDTDSGGTETYVCTATNTWVKFVAPTDNVASATALAANGANCLAGSSPLGVDTIGAAETCTDYMEEPGSNGIVAKTSANTAAARTVTGTANQIEVTNGDGVSGNPTLALSSTLVLPGPGMEFTETAGDATCGAGNYNVKANSTTSTIRVCQNGTVTDIGAGTIGGTTGTIDNAVPRANGTGGGTLQGSGVSIDDNGAVSAPGGYVATGGSLGQVEMLEGVAPGAGQYPNEHRTYIDSTTNRLATHEYGGTAKDYVTTTDAQTLSNKGIRRSYVEDVARCSSGTASAVWNIPASNGAVAACDAGSNKYAAYLGFNDSTDQGYQGSFMLKSGYSGAIDWTLRYKMAAATTGTLGFCVRLVRLPTGAAADPAFPAQAAGNCASQTVPGSAGHEAIITLTNVTCTSCVAGDRVLWLIERDANGSAVSDTATGDARLVMSGPSFLSVE